MTLQLQWRHGEEMFISVYKLDKTGITGNPGGFGCFQFCFPISDSGVQQKPTDLRNNWLWMTQLQ